ncbi:MAG: MFS transporter [Nostocoides sp.]
MASLAILRQTDFRRFFVGQTASLLGDQTAALAIPLTAILALDADAAQVGLLTAAGLLPSLLFSLPAGGWIDRRGERRRVMLVADAVRCIAVLSLPFAYALGQLSMPHLYLVAFVVGTFDVAFAVAYQALLVSIVRSKDYIAANSLLNGSRALTEVVGLSLAGVLVSLITAPVALVVNALSFAVSGIQLARIHPPEPGQSDSKSLGLAEGVRWIRGNTVVRNMLTSSATTNLFAFVGNAVLVLYASEVLGLSPSIIGIAFGVGAVGGVLGAATFATLERRINLGPAIILGSILFPLAMFLYPLAGGGTIAAAALVATGEFLTAVAVLWVDISLGAVFAQEIPDRLRSRVAGAYRMVNYGVRPLGAVAGGLIGAQFGLRNALWISAAGALCGGLLRVRPAIIALKFSVREDDLSA